MNAHLPAAYLAALLVLLPSAARADEEPPFSRITLKDGQQLRGYVVEKSDQRYLLELAGGGRMEIPTSSVATVVVDARARVDARTGEVREGDPNRTRYFYSPSAHFLKQGEGYFSQKQLLFSSVAYGLTDNISVLAGAVLPLWLFPGGGFNFIGGLKAGGQVAQDVHLAVGAETLVLPGLGLVTPASMSFVGLVFGTATYGDEDRHLSVSLGRPFFFTSFGSGAPVEVIGTVSGLMRLNQNVALLTENWVLPTPMGVFGVVSGGVRLMSGRIAVDLGGIWGVSRFGSTTVPVPWVDFTYNFG